jgi:GT2 family glycosyltransferase
MSRVSVVIPNWNGAELLSTLLPSLFRQEHPPDRVIVVDNGSADDSAGVARGAGAGVVALDRNIGFAGAVNRGIRECASEWVVILNNDVELTPGWLRNLLDRAETTGAWFASGKLLAAAERERIDGTFDAVCKGACSWRCGSGRLDSPLWNRERVVHFAPFTATLFRAELFERAGLLDEAFESYLEDADFGFRCAIQGLTGVYVPAAIAYHRGSATLGKWHPDTVYRMARNQLLLVAKYYPAAWIRKFGWRVLVAQTLWGLVAARHGAGLAFIRGKLAGLRQFRKVRSPGPVSVAAILEQSEREILDLQRASGFDEYWKLYFALT